MISAKELRIGNILLQREIYIRVHSILPTGINYQKLSPLNTWITSSEHSLLNDIQFITLTPDVLVKCGFEDEYPQISLPGDGPIVSIFFKDGEILFSGSEFTYSEPKIKYLHQLQNLYFALTGEELEVKL